jgi:cyclomaltodextrinase
MNASSVAAIGFLHHGVPSRRFATCGVLALLFLASAAAALRAQDSVDVVFRYQISGRTNVSVAGEFNGWTPANGRMTAIGGDVYVRTVRLRVGGHIGGGVAGAYQYKFWYDGVSNWPNDPLNPRMNVADNSNSVLRLNDPVIYQFIPNQRNPLVATATPVISAYIYPAVGSEVDTSALQLTIDGQTTGNLGAHFNYATGQLQFTPPAPLPNGDHTVILTTASSADTVTFTTQAGFVQITSRGGYSTFNPLRAVRGLVQDITVTSVRLIRNLTDTTTGAVAGGTFSVTDTLVEGVNTFVASADSSGLVALSSPVTFTLVVPHAPTGKVYVSSDGTSVLLDAGPTTDPDGGSVSNFSWLDDPAAPLGLAGRTGTSVSIPKPALAGEYYYGLIAVDGQGNADTSRQYFIVRPSGDVVMPGIASNPEWARKARVYFLFPKAFTSQGTLAAASAGLSRIRDLGFSVVWLMPVMKNAYPINTGTGPGYNIVDFETVAPEYGTNQDFKNFVSQAHALGLRVILDVTPNHTSRFHPWAVDGRTFGQDSRYWSWYEHSIIPHNDNGLGQSLDGSGFNYYSGFSDQLLNVNWRDPDARAELIRVYRSWIKAYDLDGFRFDVYWGPHRRYGEQYMGKPVRDALKQIKPDILLLAEDDGTGTGTEVIYADRVTGGINGGVDAAYDFKLYFNQLRGFGFSSTAIGNLHNEILNSGFYPGANSLYMRFMESQDEDRITYFYSNNFAYDATTTFRRTMPMATVLFTVPGFPMIWNGQEIGWGYGISGDKLARNRSVINWSYTGKDLLAPHYQKLAHIRGQFPAFVWHKSDSNGDGEVTSADSSDIVRLTTDNSLVYAFSRPYADQNGMTVANFSSSDVTVSVDAAAGALKFSGGLQSSALYYLNNLTENTREQRAGSTLGSIILTLPAYGSAVFTIATTPDTLVIPNPVVAVGGEQEGPTHFALEQNYPNPFNPSTDIRYSVPASGDRAAGEVRLAIYDLLGREVRVLVNARQSAGTYTVSFDAAGLASGVYLYRLSAGSFAQTRKMVLVR